VLDMKETPGLGTKLTSEKFKSQFVGKNPAKFKLKVKKDYRSILKINKIYLKVIKMKLKSLQILLIIRYSKP
jgi:Na+-transporting NADH:ubiquinone oxidoreductase subunit NqrC